MFRFVDGNDVFEHIDDKGCLHYVLILCMTSARVCCKWTSWKQRCRSHYTWIYACVSMYSLNDVTVRLQPTKCGHRGLTCPRNFVDFGSWH